MGAMGESARVEITAPSPCEKCGGPCDVEADGAKARLACRSCGHAFEVALVRAAIGTWTVIDPDGVVRRFSSWQELIGSLPIATTPYAGAVEDRSRSSRPSAAALLDVTPAPSSLAPGAPRLSLVPGDDPPPLPRQAQVQPKARVEESIEDLPDEDILPASDEITARVPPVRVSMPPPLPAAASMRPPAPSTSNERTRWRAPSASSEPPPPPALPPPPPPPKGGTLRTLPPPARRDLPAPPPPTIEVEPAPTSARAEKSSGRPAATGTSVPPSVRGAAKSPPPPTRTSAPPRSSASDAPPGPRGARHAASRWSLPFVVVGILALGFAYLRRSSSAETDTNGAGAAASSTSLANDPRAAASGAASGALAATPASNAASASSSAFASASASAMSSAAVEAKPPTTGSVSERGLVGDSQLALSEVLERAAAARKSGDAPHAKALLERALVLSPGNAEAYGLLGDLARSQGDHAGAKTSYEKALATSPSYFPALLGLADAEWDLGERDAAQRHYLAILGLGRSAPDRVKERALGGASSGTTRATGAGTSTAASTTTAPTSTATGGTTESAPSPP